MNQLALKLYPNQPGFKKRGTSEAAAVVMKRPAITLRERALEVLKRYSMNVDEIAHALGVSPLSIRPRISELVKMGLVEDTGQVRDNDSGILATVWRAK